MEDKISECWLVNEESVFFLILLREEGKITVIAMDPRKIKDARLG